VNLTFDPETAIPASYFTKNILPNLNFVGLVSLNYKPFGVWDRRTDRQEDRQTYA